MENAVSVQTLQFLYSALLGVGLGIFYDFLRCIRSHIRKSRAITGIFDVVFWVFATISFVVFILTYADGRMRWYVLFGTFCGGFVYRAAASEIVFKVMRETSKAISKLLSLATRPVYLLLKKIEKLGLGTRQKALEISKKRRRKGKADKGGSKKKEKEKRSS
ncbi:MAG: spore cortex biosynthesis protein YabQ [Clostridia bacterium]|nr:spore cortex biosynthesis protein YabQ [Clostridia bacterium]